MQRFIGMLERGEYRQNRDVSYYASDFPRQLISAAMSRVIWAYLLQIIGDSAFNQYLHQPVELMKVRE